MRRLLALLAVSMLVLGACSSDDDDDVAAETTTTRDAAGSPSTTADDTSTTTVPATTTTTAECDPGTAPTAALTGGDNATAGLLSEVVIDVAECADIIRFEFTTAVPGFSIDYQPGPIVADGSGDPVEIAGDAYLVIRFEPAYTFNFETSVETYTGPNEFVPSGQVYVAELEKTGDFEAVMTWVAGVSAETAVDATVDGTALVVTLGSPG
ncbi:MAG: hypothetical protein SGJ13_12645 [Actinomycetota bacterium]|nr:hypothetical protein [Actinomycetota bacterium]